MEGNPNATPPPPASPQIQIPPGARLTYSLSPSPAPQQRNARPNVAPRQGSQTANMISNIQVDQPRKKLILCFDGTGNKFKGNSGDTNILKVFRMLDRSEGNQFHYYQPGIGTYITNGGLSRVHVGARFKSWVNKAMDAAVGTSFDQHVIGGYKFLMRFYSPGDDIYMFGFSRGAYTARFLAEMIDHVGIVAPGNEEMVLFAWKTFSNWKQRNDNSKHKALYDYMRAFRETFARPARRVRFLGLFDTVNSVPRFEHAWLKRSSGFPYTARSTARVIRHAVGIDERRAKFRQDLVNKVDLDSIARQRSWKEEKKGKKKNKKKKAKFTARSSSSVNRAQSPNGGPRNGNANGHPIYGQQLQTGSNAMFAGESPAESMTSFNLILDQESDSDDDEELGQDVEEVWFPGAHADIGGGWDLPADEEPLSHGPLVWMVREARKAGVIFDKERMKEHNCWIEEYEDDDSPTESCESLVQTQPQHSSNGAAGARRPPAIEVTGTSPTEEFPKELDNYPPPDLHAAEAEAHPLHHPLRHWMRRRHRQVEAPRYPPKEFLERSYTRGKIHDCLCFGHGVDHIGVLGWNMMEWLPFRRMDLQPDGSWKAIIWPLPRGEVRDMPDNAKIHISALKRMEANPSYRPGNLIVGGGGRGTRIASAEHGTGDWVVIREEGNLIGEVVIKRSAWEKLTRKQKEELRGHRHRRMNAGDVRDVENQLF